MAAKPTAADAATDTTQTNDAAGADNGGAGDASNDATVQTPTLQADPAPSTTAVGSLGVPSIKLRAPEGCVAISWAGTEYDIDESGEIELPAAAQRDLQPHGFEVI